MRFAPRGCSGVGTAAEERQPEPLAGRTLMERWEARQVGRQVEVVRRQRGDGRNALWCSLSLVNVCKPTTSVVSRPKPTTADSLVRSAGPYEEVKMS